MLKYSLMLLTATLLVAVAWPLAAPAQIEETIAFVDMDTVFNEFHETKRFDERLEELKTDFEEENNELVDDIKEMNEEFTALKEEIDDPTLSSEARKRKRSEAEKMLLAMQEKDLGIRKFREERGKELNDQMLRMRERIVKKINGVVEEYATGKDLFAVIDSSGNTANMIPVVVYSVPRADITEDIIALLNEGKGEPLDLEGEATEADQ